MAPPGVARAREPRRFAALPDLVPPAQHLVLCQAERVPRREHGLRRRLIVSPLGREVLRSSVDQRQFKPFLALLVGKLQDRKL